MRQRASLSPTNALLALYGQMHLMSFLATDCKLYVHYGGNLGL